nr:hypothetical protein [uncultured Microbacterium sp.]
MNDETAPEGGSEDLAGGLISPNYPTSSSVLRSRRLEEFYIARAKMTAARDAARDRARAEGRPIRSSEIDEQLRLVDDGGPLDKGEAVGND